MNESDIADDDLRAAEKEARSHADRDKLGALALDVLERQAEARSLFAGREFVEARAVAHGVDRSGAMSAAGNFVGMLERGPTTPFEHALVVAFALVAIETRLGAQELEAARAAADRFVRHADFLETSTSYPIYPLVTRMLAEPFQAKLAAAFERAILDAAVSSGTSVRARTLVAGRLVALAGLLGPGPRVVLERLATSVDDALVRSLARVLLGGPPTTVPPEEITVEGRAGVRPSSSVRTAIRWLTGYALVAWVVRALLFVFGFRSRIRMRLAPGSVRVEREIFVLGRLVRKREHTFALAAIATATRDTRFGSLALAAGVACAAGGIVMGAWLFGDGLAASEPRLVGLAALCVLVGVVIDFFFDVFISGRRSRVAFELCPMRGDAIRVVGVDANVADRFLNALSKRAERSTP